MNNLELREKVAQKVYSLNKITPLMMARPLEWDELLETTRENFRKQADQILTLIKEANRVSL